MSGFRIRRARRASAGGRAHRPVPARRHVRQRAHRGRRYRRRRARRDAERHLQRRRALDRPPRARACSARRSIPPPRGGALRASLPRSRRDLARSSARSPGRARPCLCSAGSAAPRGGPSRARPNPRAAAGARCSAGPSRRPPSTRASRSGPRRDRARATRRRWACRAHVRGGLTCGVARIDDDGGGGTEYASSCAEVRPNVDEAPSPPQAPSRRPRCRACGRAGSPRARARTPRRPPAGRLAPSARGVGRRFTSSAVPIIACASPSITCRPTSASTMVSARPRDVGPSSRLPEPLRAPTAPGRRTPGENAFSGSPFVTRPTACSASDLRLRDAVVEDLEALRPSPS